MPEISRPQKTAIRIQGRAVRRAGELLREIEPGKNRFDDRRDGTDPPNRKAAAEAAGLAWWYRKYAREQSEVDQVLYEAAEDQARAEGIGLWRDPDPVPPWKRRRR